MNKYAKAALLFGHRGAAGESNAIAEYLEFIAAVENSHKTPEDIIAIENVLERIADEINHLLGDALDAINIAGLKIASDDMEQILDGLRRAVDKSATRIGQDYGYGVRPVNL